MTPIETEERRKWYRDLWIFLGVLIGLPLGLALVVASVFAPSILFVALPLAFALPVVLFVALIRWMWGRIGPTSSKLDRALPIGVALLSFALLVLSAPQIYAFAIILIFGAS